LNHWLHIECPNNRTEVCHTQLTDDGWISAGFIDYVVNPPDEEFSLTPLFNHAHICTSETTAYQGPGTHYPTIKTLGSNQNIIIIYQWNDWYQAYLDTKGSGQTGWLPKLGICDGLYYPPSSYSGAVITSINIGTEAATYTTNSFSLLIQEMNKPEVNQKIQTILSKISTEVKTIVNEVMENTEGKTVVQLVAEIGYRLITELPSKIINIIEEVTGWNLSWLKKIVNILTAFIKVIEPFIEALLTLLLHLYINNATYFNGILFTLPVEYNPNYITGEYGDPRAGGNHQGTDFGYVCGTPIQASADGRVTRVVDWNKGNGGQDNAKHNNYIYIDHGNNIETRYLHIQKSYVQIGQQVKRGDVIGEVGNVGWSTGCHLHFELRVGGVAVNPLTAIGEISPLNIPAIEYPQQPSLAELAIKTKESKFNNVRKEGEIHAWCNTYVQDYYGIGGHGDSIIMYNPSTVEAYMITGGIWETYRMRGACDEFGLPIMNEQAWTFINTALGWNQDFQKENGSITSIYWTAKESPSQPGIVRGKIRDYYNDFGGALSYLGFPEGEEKSKKSDCGTRGFHQNFNGGKVYTTKEHGTHAMPYGKILSEYWKQGEIGGMGWPRESIDTDNGIKNDELKKVFHKQWPNMDYFIMPFTGSVFPDGDWIRGLQLEKGLIAEDGDYFNSSQLKSFKAVDCYRDDEDSISSTLEETFIVTGGKIEEDADEITINREIRLKLYPENQTNNEKYVNGEVWLISHGWNDDPGLKDNEGSKENENPEGKFEKIAKNISQARPNDTVILLDWSEAASFGQNYIDVAQGDNRNAATWIGPVSDAVVQKLKNWGFNDWNKLNLVGHSLGTFMSAEIAWKEHYEGGDWWKKEGGKANKMILLEPASDGFGFDIFVDYDLDLRHSGHDKARKFKEVSNYSLAIYADDSKAADDLKANTAHETIAVEYKISATNKDERTEHAHRWIVEDYVKLTGNHELRNKLLGIEDLNPHSWKKDKYESGSEAYLRIDKDDKTDDGKSRRPMYLTYRSDNHNVLIGTEKSDIIVNEDEYKKNDSFVEALLGGGNDKFTDATRHSDIIYGEGGDDKIGGGTGGDFGDLTDKLYGGDGRNKYVVDKLNEDTGNQWYGNNSTYAKIMDFDLRNGKDGSDYNGDQIILSKKKKGEYRIGDYNGEVGIYLGGNVLGVVRSDGDMEIIRKKISEDLDKNRLSIFIYE
jgi:murein DD-endopeptidase MepM/ murein hydrolase activator NlpD